MSQIYDEAASLQNLLVAHATGGSEDDAEYMRLRQVLLADPALDHYIPAFLRSCRNLDQFWQFIKFKFKTYRERRQFLWDMFVPILEFLEHRSIRPADEVVSSTLDTYDAANVQAAWSKALDRRASDPEGAITMARTLLESVCKHILDDSGLSYGDAPDINKLYRQTAEQLNLAPSQHTEAVFKQILGGCTAVVEGLGALRNRLSDAHGKGKVGTKPAPRHAELAVNLAGALAAYLLATYDARNITPT